MNLTGLVILVLGAVLLDASKIYHDPEIVDRIPYEVRKSIDDAVARRLQRAVSAHFEDVGGLDSLVESVGDTPQYTHYRRARRDVNYTTNSTVMFTTNSTAMFSEWSEYSECSAKCGGGQEVRYRTCLQGDCRELGSFTEARKCGLYPCVTGSYVLGSIEPFDFIPIPNAKMVKFFSIQGARYFGYITDSRLNILKWKFSKNGYVDHQTIPVTSGVAFDILNTYPRIYLVVIEKALMIFPGRFSKMYYYNPWNSLFQTKSPVTIDVWEPSALKTFHVFGTAFLGIVNYQTKMVSNYGVTNQLLVCSGQSNIASCPIGSIITVANALYGRVTNYECATGVDIFVSWFQYFATCVVPGTKVKVSKICDNKQSCQLTADPVNFVDPNGVSCPQTNNYLRITYTCSSISHMGMPIFYKWDGVGLSLISSSKLITNGATDIESFSIHDQQYIAVANYRNDQNEHHLDSEVYIYNLDSGRFQSLQKIRTDGAVDWEFFGIGEGLAREYFLVVANHVKILPNGVETYELESVIYKWNWNLFVPFQCIKTYGAKKWTALVGDNGRFTLSVTNIHGNTTFYNYDGWRFHVASVQPKEDIFVNAIGLYAHRLTDEPMFLIQNTNEKFNDTRNFYKTTFLKTFPKHELLESTVRAVQELNRSVYEIVLPKSKIFNESYNAMKGDIVYLDNVNFTVHKTFHNINVKGNTTVDSANITTVNLSPADLRGREKYDILNQTIFGIFDMLDDANEVLDDVVFKSTEQTITSKKTFYHLNASQLSVNGDLRTGGLVNRINISDIRDRAVYLNKNATIIGKFSFTNISIRDVHVENTFSDVYPGDVVTTDGNESVSGLKTFTNTRFVSKHGENLKARSVNGIDTNDMLTVAGDQIITSNYVFNETTVVIGNFSVEDKVNMKNISAIVEDTVMVHLPGTVIAAQKQLKQMNVLGDLKMRVNATVNGIDVSELLKIGMHLASDNIESTVTFAHNVTFLSNITVLGTVNGVNLSDVVFSNVESVIVAPKVITGDLRSIANIQVNGKINGVNLTNVLNTVGNQTISGQKTFTSDVSIVNDVETSGLVDGVNISDAYYRSLMMNRTQNITGYKTFANLTADDIHLTECDHDCDLSRILSQIKNACARESVDVLNITGTKYFRYLRVGGNVNVSGWVNNVTMPGDLLLQGRNQTISGSNTFGQNVAIKGNVTVTRINDVNVSSMYEKALQKSNLTIKSKIDFADVTIKGNLSVTKAINNIYFKDVVKTFKDENVTGAKTFKNEVYIRKLYVKTLKALGLIDGVNLTALEQELLTLSGNKIVKGTKIFERGVSFLGNWSIPGLIDGVNITELYNTAMMLLENQNVSGRKTFAKPVGVTEELSVKKLVDHVNLTDLAARAVLLSSEGNQSINGDVTFENITLQNNITVNGLVSGRNISELVDDTLMKSGDQVVTGVHYINNLTVFGVVNVNKTVNGVDLSEEVVPLNGNTTITGAKTFTEDINMANVGTNIVNGFNLTEFENRVAYIDEHTFITGFITFATDFIAEKDLQVIHLINGLNFTYVITTTILKAGPQNITRHIYFEQAVFNKVSNPGLFNDVDFTAFEDNVVYKCIGPNKNITGKFSFINATMKGLSKVVDLVLTGRINELNFTLLDEQTVKETGVYNITGVKRIVGTLAVVDMETGSINGLKFPSDFVRVTGDELIVGRKVFVHDVIVKGNATVLKTINGVDISDIAESIVYLYDNETISSRVVFIKNVTVHGNMVTKLLNGLNISGSELLLSYGDQNVTASKIFSDVHTDGKVVSGNNINGFDLKKMRNESFISGVLNELEGTITIIGNVHIEGDLTTGSLDGVRNISARFYGFNRISSYLREHIPQIYESLRITRTVIRQLSASISNVHQSLDYFVDDQDIMLPYVSTSMDVLTNRGEVWLVAGALSDADGRICTNTSVFIRSYLQGGDVNFIPMHKVLSNSVTGVKFLQSSQDVYLASSSNRKNGDCLSNTPSNEQSMTYRFSASSNTFHKYASTETNRATGVDVSVLGDNVTTLFANTYGDLSTCVKQTLHSLKNSSYVLAGFVQGCNVIKSIILSQNNLKTVVAVLGSNPVGYRQLEIIDVFKNGTTYVTQAIATHFASDVIHITDSGRDFIVIANTYDTSEEALSISYTVPIAVYRLEMNGLYEPYQNIEVWAGLKMQPLRIGIYNYLVIATYTQEIVILKHKGASKWSVALKVPIQGYGSIKDLKTWSVDNEVYMAVLSSDIWNMNFPSKVRIMKGFLTSNVEGTNIMKRSSV